MIGLDLLPPNTEGVKSTGAQIKREEPQAGHH